jgi:hypothetical protein
MRIPGNPESTDDGLLFLDLIRTVKFSADGRVDIPLRRADGKRSSTPGDFTEGVRVCQEFHLMPEFDDALQLVIKLAVNVPGVRT